MTIKNFQPQDYTSKNELNKGLATTHEQVSDTYTEGTLEAEIDKSREKAMKGE